MDCCQVRKDYASMTFAERQRYIQTVKTVSTDPRYEALVAKYKASFEGLAQSTNPEESQFLAWNRYFLLEYEDLLQNIDCHVTIPYWDWTVMPVSPYLASVWNPDSGFGDSARPKDSCVENGPFRFDQFDVTLSAGGGCLRRNYRMQMFPTRAIIEQDLLTMPATEFYTFHQFLQIFIHTNVRCFVGGHMCSDDAANDPAFLLHLAQIDSIYTRWQSLDTSRYSAGLVGDNRPLALDANFTVSDFASIANLPNDNGVCYEPAEFKSHIPPSMKFLVESLEEMTNDGSLHMTCVTESELSGAHLSSAAMDYMHSMCDK